MAITVGGTSITFSDGTTQTTAGGAPTTAQVLSATAGATVGTVGTYIYAGETGAVSTSPGGTRAGSALRACGTQRRDVSWAGVGENYAEWGSNSNNYSLAGTWRCMGQSRYTNNGYGTLGYPATLWLRIS